jgi:uncharacterized protein (TIGR03083 family)
LRDALDAAPSFAPMRTTALTPTAEQYASAYGSFRARVRELLEPVDPAIASSTVPACPDWTVRDLCAHLAGVCHDLAEGRYPQGDTQAWVDAQVAARQDRTVAALLDEWDQHGPAFEAAIAENPRALAGLVHDVVSHEHDLRQTLDQPGARTSDGVLALPTLVHLPLPEQDLHE